MSMTSFYYMLNRATLVCIVTTSAFNSLLPHALGSTHAAKSTFDVVSIRSDKGPDFYQIWYDLPDEFKIKNGSLSSMIYSAFEERDEQLVSGLPKWSKAKRYDIEAKVAASDVPEFSRLDKHQRNLLWQSILQERCGLQTHYESKEVTALVLEVQRGGILMKRVQASNTDKTSSPEGRTYSPGAAHLFGVAVPMSGIVSSITAITHSLVIDKTGLTGSFNYDLHWDHDWEKTSESSKDDAGQDAGITPFAAVKDQLGLTLTRKKLLLPVLVVDHLEEPSAN